MGSLSPSVSSLNRRREIELNKERKKLEEEANYTFAPKTVTKKVFVGKDAEEDRFMALYTDAKKRHMEQKEKQKQPQDLTFTPKITSRASSRSNSAERGQSVGDRLYRATSAAFRSSSKAVARISSDDTEQTGLKSTKSAKSVNSRSTSRSSITSDSSLLGTRSVSSSKSGKSDCSFTPSISKRAKSIDRSTSADKIGDRLYSHSKVIKEKLEKVKAEREQKASAQCTFTPRTNATPTKLQRSSSPSPASSSSRSSSANQSSVVERMKKYEEYKVKRLEQAVTSKIEHETAVTTFKPQLVAKRASTPTTNVPVHERLSQPIEKDRSEIEAIVYAENTFRPQLVAKRQVSPNPANAEYSSATERLFKEGEKKKKEAELERQQVRDEMFKEFCFMPKLGFGSKIKEKEGGEPQVPVFDRLSSLHSRAFMDEILLKIKSEIELKDCTFQPRIPVPRTPCVNNIYEEPVHIRLNREAEVIRAEKIRREAEKIAEELASATFSPSLPDSSIEIARRRSVALSNGEDEEDVYTRLTKHSPKMSYDFDGSLYGGGSGLGLDNESIDTTRTGISTRKSIVLPEQVRLILTSLQISFVNVNSKFN